MKKVLILLLLISPFSLSAQKAIDAAKRHFEENGAKVLREYRQLLELPNVTGNNEALRKNAVWIQEALERRGIETELLEAENAAPVVYGALKTPGAKRTLGVYVHYDGQPVDTTQWRQSPWLPTLYTGSIEEGARPREFPKDDERLNPEWRIYARSAADDKAPIISVLATLDALKKEEIPLRSNLVFFFEGEEESGSRNLKVFLENHQSKFDVDVWLIFDGPSHQSRRPQLVFGVRGSTGLEITVYGANRYLHSGHYGNWAPNAAMRLSQLLASMKDESGKVLIEGFYDSAAPIERAVKQAVASSPPFEEALRKELGLAETEFDNAAYLDQMLIPALEIRGIESAKVGALARNVIPPTATASVNVRLVKGNVPTHMLDLVEAHIRKQGYHIVYEEPSQEIRIKHRKIVKVRRQGGSPGFRTSMELPAVQRIIAQARSVAGDNLVLTPTMGGTLPLYLFEEKFGKPIIITPIANHDNNQHGPNENLRLGNLRYGMMLMAAIFSQD